jgi:hypothetical protein
MTHIFKIATLLAIDRELCHFSITEVENERIPYDIAQN